MARRRGAVVAAGLSLALAAACTGGSSDGKASPSPAKDLSPALPFERAALEDGAAGLWSLRDATDLRARDEVADLTSAKAAATVVGGTISKTDGPGGGAAAKFFRSGRIVTQQRSGLSSTDAFTLELDLRADACVDAWGRVAGTTSLGPGGREGFEVLHFPRTFPLSACRFGVEFWHLDKHLGGCHPKKAPVVGVWTHWTIAYASGRVTCYLDGKLEESTLLAAPRLFRQLGPLGIGGSGSGFQGPLDGASLSEVAFYRRALTAAEIGRHAALAKQPVPASTATPTAKPSASPSATLKSTPSAKPTFGPPSG